MQTEAHLSMDAAAGRLPARDLRPLQHWAGPLTLAVRSWPGAAGHQVKWRLYYHMCYALMLMLMLPDLKVHYKNRKTGGSTEPT